PMLVDKCTACHQTGGVGPWAMTSYDMVKGFAPMIREVVRTQRMPPWHADPHYGVWQNSRALTDDQRKLLVHWIEAGAPRGSGPDPLLKVKPDTSEWKHGKPDLVVEIPAYDIPATGVLFPKDADFVFQMHYTPNGQAVTDHSKVAFYFREADNPPKYPLHLTALVDFRFQIPPGAKEYGTTVTRDVTRDMLVYNF